MKLYYCILGGAICTFTFAACRQEPSDAPGKNNTAANEHAHDDEHHHGAGPHGGTIAEWGSGEYHVEFAVDHDKKEAAVYVLDGNAKSAAPIEASSLLLTINDPPFQLELKAKPLDGETDGKSSRFVGEHESLGIVREFEGTISAEVDGTPYAGDFKEEAADHDHP